jgi:copper homeostasis protein
VSAGSSAGTGRGGPGERGERDAQSGVERKGTGARDGARVLLEICAPSWAAAAVAAQGGADRVELCERLDVGGLTPGRAHLRAAAVAVPRGVPIVVLVRPRAGDFVYAGAEVDAMRRAIDDAREAGAAGVALGVLRADGSVHVAHTEALVRHAAPLPVCFHRAFDAVPDPRDALDELAALGVARVLTSLGRARALDAADDLAALVGHAAGRLAVMPGGGVRSGHVAALVEATGAREVHSSAGLGEQLQPDEVVALRRALDAC